MDFFTDTEAPTPAPEDPDICAEHGDGFNYIYYNGDCYKGASAEMRSWQTAEDHCK